MARKTRLPRRQGEAAPSYRNAQELSAAMTLCGYLGDFPHPKHYDFACLFRLSLFPLRYSNPLTLSKSMNNDQRNAVTIQFFYMTIQCFGNLPSALNALFPVADEGFVYCAVHGGNAHAPNEMQQMPTEPSLNICR